MSVLLLWLSGRMTTSLVARECDRPRPVLASIKSGRLRAGPLDIAALATWANLTQREVLAAITRHQSKKRRPATKGSGR